MSADEGINPFQETDAMKDPREALKELQKTYDQLKEAKEKKIPIQEAMNIGEDEMFQMYSMGFLAYETKHYIEAQFIFSNLFMLNPRNERYAYSLASVLKVQGNYADALLMFGIAMALNQDSALYCYYAGECAWMTGQAEIAKKGMEECVKRSPKDPDAKEFVKLAEVMLENIANGAQPPKHVPPAPTLVPDDMKDDEPPKRDDEPPTLPGGGRRRMRV